MAWGNDLGDATPSEPGGCYFLTPPPMGTAPFDIGFMIEGDRFSRIDVGNDGYTAPGGGKVGMDLTQLRTLYAGRVEEQPHKYIEGGKVLRIRSGADHPGVLVFETDAAGKATSWRVGLPPQVDYVEGCS
jgi:hypothetical protein